MRYAISAIALLLSACGAGVAGSSAGQTSVPAQPVVRAPDQPVDAHPLYTDKVGFIGDSITWIWNSPERLLQQNLLSSHLPDFVDAGVSGNETGQMLARFDTDVLAYHPDVVVILGGVNDIKNSVDAEPAAIASNIFAMVQKAESAGAKVIVGTVMAIDIAYAPQTFLDQAGPRIDALNRLLVAGASAYGYTIVDYHTPMLAADGAANGALLADGLHPNDAGYAVMWKALIIMLPAEARGS